LGRTLPSFPRDRCTRECHIDGLSSWPPRKTAPLTDIQLSELRSLLASPRLITIVSHKNPDGDAIGSSLGLYHYLIGKGHTVSVVMPTDYPQFLKWMDGTAIVLNHERDAHRGEALVMDCDVLFCLDFNTPDRAFNLEKSIRASRAKKVMIDHHPQPEPFVDFMLSDTSSCSTAQLVHRFITLMGDKVTSKACAECLYTGILTDSGSFRFPSVTSETHRIVADLLDAGVDHAAVYDLIHNAGSEQRIRLLGYCINDKLTVMHEFGVGFISLSMQEKERFHFRPGDTEGTVNYPLSIEGVHFSAMFIEDKDTVKISFRSIGDFDVNAFSRAHFDGGGHRNAAGGRCDLSLDETLKKFVALLPQYAEQLGK
jgi:bifunctional oligoribonuclease and PAP phosphatase NrnA